MIEAKGPGYARLLRFAYFAEDVLPQRWRRQAERQVDASSWHGLEWFFAELEAQKKAKEIFEDDKERFGKIEVRHEPAWVK